MWLTGRLVPDHKTIADFRKDNGPAIKKVCAQVVALCRKMGLLAKASVAIDGSKFKAVNSRDNNFTKGKMERRLAQIEESVARYLSQLDTADRQTAAGLDSVEITVDVKLEHRRRMIRRPAGRCRIDAIEPEVAEFQRIDEHIDRANRIALVDPIIKAFRQQRHLLAIRPLNETLHHSPAIQQGNHSIDGVFTQSGSVTKEAANEGPPTEAALSHEH